MSFADIICWPFAKLLTLFYNWTGSYGVAIIVFAIAVNLILLPFMAKSKKGMMRTTRLQPKLQELQRKHEGNQQKLQEETMKLYREEGVSPTGGCLWSLIPFPIIIILYGVIRQPLRRMMGLAADVVEQITEWATANAGYVAAESQRSAAYAEIGVANSIHQHFQAAVDALGNFGGKLIDLDYSFLGMNLGEIPDVKIWTYDFSDAHVWLPAVGMFMIPILCAVLSWLSMEISQKTNPTPATAQTAQSMKVMNLMMPIMSIWICFVMPAALGIYWIANSVLGIARDYSLTKIYKKKLDEEDAERRAAQQAREEELQRRREETERLRAEGNTVRNKNTSKKNVQAKQKQESDERKAAIEKAEREARRERLGIEPTEAPASQVGNRRYARGRAYDPDRFANAAAAAAETEEPAEEAEVEAVTEKEEVQE